MPDKDLTPEEIARNKVALRYLKAWLRFRDINQRELADRLQMSEPQVSKWLRGLVPMTLAQFTQIAALLDTQPDDLLFPPPAEGKGRRYRRAAEIAQNLPDDLLEHWLAVGRAMLEEKKESPKPEE